MGNPSSLLLYTATFPLIFIATTLCLADKALISSEVLVSVIKEVVRRSPLPVIFMRTVSFHKL